jgi:hypothetical protein
MIMAGRLPGASNGIGAAKKMGIEYDFYNHRNATIFELGKGPWYSCINDDLEFVREPDFFVEILKEEWTFFDAENEKKRLEYFNLLAEELEKFVKDTPDSALKAVGDSGDDDLWAAYLKYKYVGTRYALGSPENKIYLDELNARQIQFGSTLTLSANEIENLKTDGWNLKNIR